MKFPRAADGSEGDTKGQKCSAGNEGGSVGGASLRGRKCSVRDGGGSEAGGAMWKGMARRRPCKSLEGIDSQGTTEVSYVFCTLCM